MTLVTRKTCQVPGCCFGDDQSAYITQEGLSAQDLLLRDLKLHHAMAHGNVYQGHVNKAGVVGAARDTAFDSDRMGI